MQVLPAWTCAQCVSSAPPSSSPALPASPETAAADVGDQFPNPASRSLPGGVPRKRPRSAKPQSVSSAVQLTEPATAAASDLPSSSPALTPSPETAAADVGDQFPNPASRSLPTGVPRKRPRSAKPQPVSSAMQPTEPATAGANPGTATPQHTNAHSGTVPAGVPRKRPRKSKTTPPRSPT